MHFWKLCPAIIYSFCSFQCLESFFVQLGVNLVMFSATFSTVKIQSPTIEELVPKRTKEMSLRSNSFRMARCNWFILIGIPWATQRSGKKVILGDNLSSHVRTSVGKEYTEKCLSFSCLLIQLIGLCRLSSNERCMAQNCCGMQNK